MTDNATKSKVAELRAALNQCGFNRDADPGRIGLQLCDAAITLAETLLGAPPTVTKKDLVEGKWYAIKYRHHDPEMAKFEDGVLYTEFQAWDPSSVVIKGPIEFEVPSG